MNPEEEIKTTEQNLIDDGYKKLTNEQLHELLVDKTVWGDFEYKGWRKFISYINPDGTIEGLNDWDSNVEGHWIIQNDSLTFDWDGYWIDWTGNAYEVDGEIKFYDVETNLWMSSFTKIEDGELPLEL